MRDLRGIDDSKNSYITAIILTIIVNNYAVT